MMMTSGAIKSQFLLVTAIIILIRQNNIFWMIFWIGVYGILLFCRVNFFWKRVFVRAISSCSTVVHIFNYFSIEICLNPEFFFIIKCHKDVRYCSLCCFSQQASQVTSPRHLLSSLSFDEKQTVTLTPFRNCIICSKKPENQSAI